MKDHLAVSERPGGFAPNHRRVRRQEEIIWLRVQGFDRVISLLPSPHNLHAYDEGELVWAHYPLLAGTDSRQVLESCYRDLAGSLAGGKRVLMHHEEMGDRVMGVVAGFLVWWGRIPSTHQAVATVEHMVGRQMGPAGRELAVAVSGPSPRFAG
jgi:hypothetical protein